MSNTAGKFLAVTGVLVALTVAPAPAQEFPARPVQLIVPLLPGAGTDVVARTFANALAQGLGQSVVVENKAGAATTLGANFVAKSTPDGYTLLVATTSTLSVLPTVQIDTVRHGQGSCADRGVFDFPVRVVRVGRIAFQDLERFDRNREGRARAGSPTHRAAPEP